ncbi:SR-related and CTD-associated factor 8-like [Frieseomelitta varia]|uniref:SR-related and CTD-associated factor 8-like n=1 Tax=Frieseomelitta varia TaxID=561572 RepID=UPI001CB69992|nr:SR-related and CTD-associated factor 8-like [Frieseomelitta varia]
MKHSKLTSLIFILYYTAVYKCDISCAKFHNLQESTSIRSNYPNTYHDYTDYKIRSERQLKETDLNNFIKQNRNSRGVKGSSQHLRLGDAHQVANYFLTGGPLKGHAHFLKERNCDENNDDDNTEEANNPTIETNNLPINDQNSNTTSSDFIVGAVHIPPALPHIPPALPHIPPALPHIPPALPHIPPTLPHIPPALPHIPPALPHITPALPHIPLASPHIPPVLPHIPPLPHIPLLPISSQLNSIIHPALNTISKVPHLLGNNLLQSLLHPNLHPHINALHNIPNTLIQTASVPMHGIMNARSEFHKLLHSNESFLGGINKAIENRKAKKNLKNNLMYPIGQSPIVGLAPTNFNNVPLSSIIEPHLPVLPSPPNGYIVHYVPHNKQTASNFPVVGSPQQPSTYKGSDSNVQEDFTNPSNNENGNVNESKHST